MPIIRSEPVRLGYCVLTAGKGLYIIIVAPKFTTPQLPTGLLKQHENDE